jgi:serine/threonine-protein kinase
LKHPNILIIHELGKDQGRTFLVSEFVEGRTLKEMLTDGPLHRQEATAVALQIAKGLQAAHQLGSVHRDIKPANIMILPDGHAKILDFGLALSSEDGTVTETGALMGSPPYMSPEQKRAKRSTCARTFGLWAY